ncbi:helix-turn-helix domain-containing protein [Virgibacillus halodenitrificans]|uniref:helix-turn-helix domain-containing protein n=1 Tax=Virgibacillus halodenitrificans TaxID=1482 RepID=UPI0002F55B4E|nr:helix-turn-helix transcriptional regulator [Virgibacillus halodenitrificans]
MSIGQRIIKTRELKGWNQRELSRRVGLNASVMNRIESGERPVKDHELVKIASALEVTSDYLVGLSESPYRTQDEELEELLKDPNTQLMFHDWKNMSDEERKEAIDMIKYIMYKSKRGD